MSAQTDYADMIDELRELVLSHLVECPDGATLAELQKHFAGTVLGQRQLLSGKKLIESMIRGADSALDTNELTASLAKAYVSVAVEHLVATGQVKCMPGGMELTADGRMPQPYQVTALDVYRPTYECWLERVS